MTHLEALELPYANNKGDWNWDIHIRDIKEEDFYDGLMVQSYGNSETIYEVFSTEDEVGKKKWFSIPRWVINYRRVGYLQSDLRQFNPFYFDYLNHQVNDSTKWSETFYSIKVNKILQRDIILDEILKP